MILIISKSGVNMTLPDQFQEKFISAFMKPQPPMFAVFNENDKPVLCINLHDILSWQIIEEQVVKPTKGLFVPNQELKMAN